MPEDFSDRVLIIGASGQLGHALCRRLGPRALPSARRQLDPAWLRLDLEEIAARPALLEELVASHSVSAVICAAGATDVERCERDILWAEAANHTGPLALARAFRSVPFVFLSTDYVFSGRADDAPYPETAPTEPLSVYGRTKLEGELAVADEHPSPLIVRTTTVYGPDPQSKNFLYTLSRVITSGNVMRVPTDQWSTPTYNEDLAAAILDLLAPGEPSRSASGVFHVAGPAFLSRYEFALEACRLLNLDPAQVQPVTTAELGQKAARPLQAGLRIDKLTETLGRNPMRTPAEGIAAWLADPQPLHPCMPTGA